MAVSKSLVTEKLSHYHIPLDEDCTRKERTKVLPVVIILFLDNPTHTTHATHTNIHTHTYTYTKRACTYTKTYSCLCVCVREMYMSAVNPR